jgi:hypothetical protein
MASVKDFNRLAQISGVAHYILVRGDGRVVSENMEDAASLGPIIAASGTQCDALAADMGGNRFIHLCIERESGNDLLVFSLGRYYLGILKHADSPRQEIIDNVIYFLQNLS